MGRYDVVVIGGGFAGVCAARDLGHAGLSVVIVEARDRLGGKTWTAPFPGTAQSVEMGGTWVSPNYHLYVRREIERYGLELSPSRAGEVRFSWSFVGKDSRAFPVDGDELYDLERAWYQIIKESHRIERDTPRDQHDLADLDVSVAEFLDRLALGPQTRQFLEAFAALGSGADPTEWSALTALSWVAAMDHSAWGWYASVVDKLAAGTGGAIQKMVEDSRADVVLSAPITHVEQDQEGVTVRARDGATFRGAHAVVASPIATWHDIEWGWSLSPEKVNAAANPHAGRMRKIWVRLAGAPTDVIGFGLGGQLLWISPEYDLDDGTQLMVCFSAPQNGLTAGGGASIQAAVEHHFPGAQVIDVAEHDWSADPWAKGTWMCTRPGLLSTQISALQASEGRVHFANADLANRWIGWIDGALESAGRAANAVQATSTS